MSISVPVERKVPCSFSQEGCKWTGTTQELCNHVEGCNFAVQERCKPEKLSALEGQVKALQKDLQKSKERCKEWETLCLDFESRSEKEKAGAANEKRELERQISSLKDTVQKRTYHGRLLENPTLDMEWEKSSDLEYCVWDCSAVCIGDFVYAGGGKSDKDVIVLKYSCQGETWGALATTQRSKFAMVCFQNQLLLIGGMEEDTSTVLSSVLVWDEHKWSNGKYPPLNERRYNASATAVDIYIVVAGGEWKNKLSTVEVYSETTKTWVFVASLPFAVSLAKLVAFQHKLYLAGGEGPEVFSAPMDDLFVSRRINKIWKKMSDIPDSLKRVTIVVFGGDLLAIGGIGTTFSSDKVRVYFPGRDVWLPLKNALPDTYYGMAAAELPSGELLLVGGCAKCENYKHVVRGSLQDI